MNNENYFNYFTEIEEHFQRLWGGILRLSPLDWSLIEVWKDSGIPLEAVLRGMESTFKNYEKRRRSPRKVNGLGFCTQEVLAAAEEMKEAVVGTDRSDEKNPLGFDMAEISAFLRRNADSLENAKLPAKNGISGDGLARDTAGNLRQLADDLQNQSAPQRLEDLERRLTVMEEKLFAILLAATADEEVVTVRAEADRAMAPYRSKMPAAQIEQLMKQYIHKRLMEKYKLPRLSLFYM